LAGEQVVAQPDSAAQPTLRARLVGQHGLQLHHDGAKRCARTTFAAGTRAEGFQSRSCPADVIVKRRTVNAAGSVTAWGVPPWSTAYSTPRLT
jgi:hypothetical protein